MHPLGRALISIAALALAAAGAPGAASADERRIVLLDVEGARDSRLRKQLAILIRKQHRIVSARSYERTARKMRARKLIPKNVRRVCRDLPCDGLLEGTVVADDGAYTFEVRLREGATGRLAKKVTIRLRKPRLTVPIGKQLRRRLLVAIDRLRPLDIDDRRGDEDFEEGIVEAEEEEFDREEERRAERRWRARERERRRAEQRRRTDEERFEDEMRGGGGDDGEEGDLDDFDDSDLEDEEPDRVAMADGEEPDEDAGVDKGLEEGGGAVISWNAPISLAGGVSVVSRSLDFSYQQGLENAPPGYSGSYVPAAYVAGELYPFDFAKEGEKGALKDLGVGFRVERVLQLESAVTDDMGAPVANLRTTHEHIGASLRYRYQFGDEPSAPTIVLSAGVSRLTFQLEKGDAPMGTIVDVPNTQYTYVDPGLFGRIPVAGQFAFVAGAKAMLVLDAGEIQEPEQYGTATVTGVDADAAVEYALGENFSIRVGSHLTLLGFAFKGNGLQTTDRDNDPGKDVGGARDAYLGGYTVIGYRY